LKNAPAARLTFVVRQHRRRGGSYTTFQKEKIMLSMKGYFYRAAFTLMGVDINEELGFAANEARTNMVKALLEAGADVHDGHDRALRWAAGRNSYPATCEALLKSGANVHVWDNEPLREAEKNGHDKTGAVLRQWMVAPHHR